MKIISKAFVVGDPIAHSLSPLLHQTWLKQTRTDGSYEKRHINQSDLSKKLKALFLEEGFVGANITLPHKRAVLQIADEVTIRAKQTGAANLLYIKNNKIIILL